MYFKWILSIAITASKRGSATRDENIYLAAVLDNNLIGTFSQYCKIY